MDERLKLATEHANYSKSMAAQRNILQTKYQADIVVAFNGGLFDCDRALISYVDMLIRDGYEGFPIIAKNNIPVMVDDLVGFKGTIMQKHANAVNEFHREASKLKKFRNVGGATEV